MTDFNFVPVQDFAQAQIGKTTQGYVFPGSLRGSGADPALHGAAMQGSSPTPGLQQYAFKGGKDALTINVDDNTKLQADTSYLTVNGKKIFFGTVSTKIAIGSDAAETETNIKNFLDGATAYSPAALEASIDTGHVLVKGTGKKLTSALTITTNQTDALTIADATAASGVASKMVFQFEGDLFADYTQQQFDFFLDVNSKKDNVSVIALTPASADLISLTEACKSALDTAHGGGGIDEADGYIHSRNLANYSQISTAFQTAFGNSAATAFVISGDDSNILTITWGTKGTVGNAQHMQFSINPSIPDVIKDLYLGPKNVPTIDERGPAIPLGSIQAINSNDAPQTASVPQDSGLNDFGTGLTGIQSGGSFTLNQIHNQLFQRIAGGAAATARTAGRDLIMSGGGSLEVWTLIFVTDTDTPGQKHVEVILEAIFTGGIQKELTKASAKGVAATYSCLADGSAAPTKITGLFRQIKQV